MKDVERYTYPTKIIPGKAYIKNYPGDTEPSEPIWIPWNDRTLQICPVNNVRTPTRYV